MEPINQQPEGSAASATPPPAAGQAPAAPAKAANLNQAVERAAESANQTPVEKEGQPEDWEWDGNPNNLPPQFAKHGKGIQKYFTKRSMQEAEIRKAGQDYQQLLTSDEYKQFQEYKKTLGQPVKTVEKSNLPKQQLISKEEYEDALLDGSGEKFAALVEKVAEQKLKGVQETLSGTVSQVRQEQLTNKWNAAISDFADVHPEAVEYHEMGLMEPIVKEEMASGKHNSYSEILEAAYKRVDAGVQRIRQKEMSRSQGRITEKKDAVVSTGTSTGDFQTVETDKADVLTKAFEFAAQNKKVKVRSKR